MGNIDKSKLTEAQIQKAMACSSVEELMKVAKEEGYIPYMTRYKRAGILYRLPSSFHLILWAFVHGDVCALKPTLLPKVTTEVAKERHDEIVVFLLSGTAGELLHTVRCAVVIVETVVPGNERVAVDLFRDAARHHKLYPAVEHGVVVAPTAVELFHLGYHALERVVGLAVPRMADDGASDNFLPGSRE